MNALDQQVRQLIEQRDAHAVTELVYRRLGAEIMGFLVATLRDELFAKDVFSETMAAFLRGCLAFRGETSVRRYLYRIALNAALNHMKWLKRRKETDLNEATHLAQPAERTQTPVYMKSDVKTALSRVRDGMAPEDRALLVLRVDRGLEWTAIEDILGVSPATLRKRFERLKQRLATALMAEGVPAASLGGEEPDVVGVLGDLHRHAPAIDRGDSAREGRA